MVFLGYILASENQAEYMADVKLAAKLEKNDVLENAMKQKVMQMSETQPAIQPPYDLEKTIKSIFATIKEPVNVDVSEVLESKPPTPLDFEISDKTDELNRPLTAQEEINIENKLDPVNIKKMFKNLPKPIYEKMSDIAEEKMSDIAEDLEEKPAPNVAKLFKKELPKPIYDPPVDDSVLSSVLKDTESIQYLTKLYNILSSKEKDPVKKYGNSNEILINLNVRNRLGFILKDDPTAIVYGARSNREKKGKHLLKYDEKTFSPVFADTGEPLDDSLLRKTIELNLNKLGKNNINIRGKGLADSDIYIDLKDDNLVVKRSSKAKNKLIYLTNISPLLKKTILQMQKDKSFDLDIYDVLKESEKQVINKLITLLKLDTPDRVKSSIQDAIFNLKNRYEILIGEMRAGNDGKIVSDELKQVVIKLYDLKAIGLRKKNAILNALNE